MVDRSEKHSTEGLFAETLRLRLLVIYKSFLGLWIESSLNLMIDLQFLIIPLPIYNLFQELNGL